MRLRTAVIWNGVSQFGSTGITLLSTVILSRLLTPDDFAIIGIVTIFIAISQMMVDSEMGGALLRKPEVTVTDYSTLFYYNLGVSIVLYGV
ncbi:MAG: oligosaccharide flippase family protein, partial [Muribaculaceae bacterium]|nr:oligosaccharide flippase family protein [Muribaculaceae bacterium]